MNVSKDFARCPLEDIMSTITKRWLLLVLNQIGAHGNARYNELLETLRPISPKALADVLKELQKAGLISRNESRGTPTVISYTLNSSGKKLQEAVVPLLKWAALYTGHTDCPIISRSRPVGYATRK
ncbi:MAG: helix-turn-helix domain-containing protein [Candidatus Micrarchaeaceae archaeon]